MSEESTADEYDFLTHEQWVKVCELLRRDMEAETPLRFVAPSYPEAGQEMYIAVELERPRMIWINDFKRDLSEWILKDDCTSDFDDEMHRAITSLANTVNVLKAAYRQKFGRVYPD